VGDYFEQKTISDLSVKSTLYKDYVSILDNYRFKSIICHSVRDAIFIRNYIDDRKIEAKLLFMSHSPELPSSEFYHRAKQGQVLDVEKKYEAFKLLEETAFSQADILIFPTQEAMEPYIQASKMFKDLLVKKDVRFIPTGCDSVVIEGLLNNDLRQRYNIQTKYIISFIGRHTYVKGYDLLQRIAKVVLAKRDDVTFVIGGEISQEISPLNHPRWIELGRINPAELLSITDLFILPNRQTYFDLILLEVLSAGIPTIASNTGGNKSVFKATQVINLYNTEEECVDLIDQFLALSDEEKRKKHMETRLAFANNYTLMHFAQRYYDLIQGVIK
jgi:glycosyltransferase involved in cell wall biosynthesis